jgi:hypothetical protein
MKLEQTFILVYLFVVHSMLSIDAQVRVFPCNNDIYIDSLVPIYWIENDKPRYEYSITLLFDEGKNTLKEFHPETFHFWSHIVFSNLPDSLIALLDSPKFGTWYDEFFDFSGNYSTFTFKYSGKSCDQAILYLKVIQHINSFKIQDIRDDQKQSFISEIAGYPFHDGRTLFNRYGLGIDSLNQNQLYAKSLDESRIHFLEADKIQNFSKLLQGLNRSILLVGDFESCICKLDDHSLQSHESQQFVNIEYESINSSHGDNYFYLQHSSVGVPSFEIGFSFNNSDFFAYSSLNSFFFLAELRRLISFEFQNTIEQWKQSIIHFNIKQEFGNGTDCLFIIEFVIKKDGYKHAINSIMQWANEILINIPNNNAWQQVRNDLNSQYNYMYTREGRPSNDQIKSFWILGMSRMQKQLTFNDLYHAYQSFQAEFPVDSLLGNWEQINRISSPIMLFISPEHMDKVGEWAPKHQWKIK